MSRSYDHLIADPRMRAAIAELQDLILSHAPGATFTIGEAEDPDGVYMRAIIDVDDTDEVTEHFIDRLVDLQVDERLPLYVVTVRTPQRVVAALERERTARAHFAMPS